MSIILWNWVRKNFISRTNCWELFISAQTFSNGLGEREKHVLWFFNEKCLNRILNPEALELNGNEWNWHNKNHRILHWKLCKDLKKGNEQSKYKLRRKCPYKTSIFNFKYHWHLKIWIRRSVCWKYRDTCSLWHYPVSISIMTKEATQIEIIMINRKSKHL